MIYDFINTDKKTVKIGTGNSLFLIFSAKFLNKHFSRLQYFKTTDNMFVKYIMMKTANLIS